MALGRQAPGLFVSTLTKFLKWPRRKGLEKPASLHRSWRRPSTESVFGSFWTSWQAQSAEVSFATMSNWLTCDFPTVSSFLSFSHLSRFSLKEKERLRDPVGVSWTQSKETHLLGLDSPEGGKRCQLQLMWTASLAPETSGYSKCDSMNYLQLQWTTFNCIIACTPWWELAAWISLTLEEKERRGDLEMTDVEDLGTEHSGRLGNVDFRYCP